MTSRSRVLWAAAVLLLSIASGCSIWLPDLVEQRQLQAFSSPQRIAVAPFHPSALLSKRARDSGTEAWEAATLVGGFVAQALEERSFEVISEPDLTIAFESEGKGIPGQSPEVLARLAHAKFGVEAILLGTVGCYREREGSAYGSFAPASVEFEVTLYSAPEAVKLWIARFDQTQESISSNLFTSARYPSGGTRFLTVAELARWGAGLIAEALRSER